MWLETKISEWHRLGVAEGSRMAMQSKGKPGASSKNLLELGIFQLTSAEMSAMLMKDPGSIKINSQSLQNHLPPPNPDGANRSSFTPDPVFREVWEWSLFSFCFLSSPESTVPPPTLGTGSAMAETRF